MNDSSRREHDATIAAIRDEPARPLPQTPPPQLLRRFGDYELLEEIARGGMGIVFKARQASLNRVVAVKMILAGQLADDAAVRRFRQEAEAAAGLDHPGIVPVFEVGECDGQQFFSMGFVDGQSLAEKLTAGPVAPREAAGLIEQVARALQFAHERGVIHRDLKPANVLVDRDGRPRVTDFGLAKVAASEQSLTVSGQMLGTPGYMPPEQVDGLPAGPRADVYGLGAILYALLTGRPPFQAATLMDTLQQVKQVEAVPPRLLNPSVPRDLDTIVRKCLEKWPDWRYESAAELADELRRFLAGEPIRSRRPGVVESGVRWFKRQSRSVALAAGTVAATLLLAVVGMLAWAGYEEWRLGRVTLKTDRPPLVAELLDERGELAAPPFTVPTQEPVAVPAGEYQLRLSQPLRFSQSYRLSIARDATADLAVDLEDQLLNVSGSAAELPVELSFAIITRRGRADVLVLDDSGLRRPGWPSNDGETWSLDLRNQRDLPRRLRWPWSEDSHYEELARTLLHPQVVREAPDLDGDGVEDVVVAARHQAWLLAVSGRTGKIVWFAGRGADFPPGDDDAVRQQRANHRGAVLGEPLLVGDRDGDGVSDLLALFADDGDTPIPAPVCWLECLSSKTGRTLWRFDCDAAWFQTPAGVEWLLEARWFVTINGSSSGGGSQSSDYGNVVRQIDREEPSGDWHPAPYPPLLIEAGERKLAVLIAGTSAIVLDVATGEPARAPIQLGLPAARPPQLADLDGDSRPELVLVQPVPPTTPGRPPTELLVSAWPVGRMASSVQLNEKERTDEAIRPTWQHKITAEVRRGLKITSPLPAWPLLADLDGDGSSEVIVPHRPPPPPFAIASPWTEIAVLNGADGNDRWRRRLKSMDLQIDHLLVGPDINGDGHRELFTAALHGERYDLFVDVLSGKDGQTLWWTSRRIGHSAWVESLAAWSVGKDGWPRLLVSTIPEESDQHSPQTFVFSAGDGRFTGHISEIDQIQFTDADGDGQADLFGWQRKLRDAPTRGGRLLAFRNSANERWRRLGGEWQPAGDYDGDGHADLAAVFQNATPTVAAISGRDGHVLWRRDHDLGDQAQNPLLQPLAEDFDGDGTPDLLVRAGTHGGSTAMSPRTKFPVVAISGRSGAKLWSVEITFSSFESVIFAAARDLDGDGTPEVLFSTVTDWDYPRDTGVVSSANMQHWLAVLEGRTGKFCWRQPLSVAYGLPGAPQRDDSSMNADLRPLLADLNRDGVLDVVLPAEAADSPDVFGLRAYSGRDGQPLWQRRSTADVDLHNRWQNAVPPACVDLDGDGSLEVIGMEYLETMANYRRDRTARMFALDAVSGREIWKWEAPVEQQCGRAGSYLNLQAAKPRPLVLRRRDGRPLLAVGFWHGGSHVPQQDGRIAVLDHTGRLVAERPVEPGPSSVYRTWLLDVDSDGNDDLLLINAGKLWALAIHPQSTSESPPAANAGREFPYEFHLLWELSLPAEPTPQIMEIQSQSQNSPLALELRGEGPEVRGATGSPPIIVVQCGSNLHGIAGSTGQPAWLIAGPQPRAATDDPLETAARMLDPSAAIFQWGQFISICREARPIGAAAPSREVLPPTPPQLHPPPDPRLARPLRWSFDLDRGRAVRRTLWGMTLAVFVLLAPAGTLLRMIVRRQWSLATFLVLPLFAGLMILLLTMPVPRSMEPMVLDRVPLRFNTAASHLALPIFFLLLLVRLRESRWRSLLGWIIAIVALATAYAASCIVDESRLLAPGEHLALTDLDIPLARGLYLAAWIATVLLAGSTCLTWFRRKRQTT